jgi:hypothetical protein
LDCSALALVARQFRNPIDTGNIEPLPTGDRQREKRVAKARNPLQ